MRFTVATYNIHKGFTQLNRRMVIHELRERLHGLSADILLLQEVVGVHRGHAPTEQGPEHTVHQSARPAIHQRQSGGDQRVVRGSEPDLLGEGEAQNHPRFAVVGQSLPGRAVDQCIEVGEPPQRLARDGDRERPVGRREVADRGGCGLEGLPAAKHRIEQLQRRAARSKPFNAWH